MDLDLLDLYGRASEWTSTKVAGAASKLNVPTSCDGWDVRTLMNHMLQTQHYFVAAARGENVAPPTGTPPDLVGDEPRADFERARAETLRTFGEPGVIDKTGPALGIAFSDQFLHGWDLATSHRAGGGACPTGSLMRRTPSSTDASPTSNARASSSQRSPSAPDASAQDKLLAYTGRDPVDDGLKRASTHAAARRIR